MPNRAELQARTLKQLFDGPVCRASYSSEFDKPTTNLATEAYLMALYSAQPSRRRVFPKLPGGYSDHTR